MASKDRDGGSHKWSIINRDTHCSLSSKASGICLIARSCAPEQKGAFIFFWDNGSFYILKQNLFLKFKNKQEGLVTVKIALGNTNQNNYF